MLIINLISNIIIAQFIIVIMLIKFRGRDLYITRVKNVAYLLGYFILLVYTIYLTNEKLHKRKLKIVTYSICHTQ